MNSELVTRAIMYLEPALRSRGRSIDWERFNSFVGSGEFNSVLTDNQPEIEKAIARYNEDPEPVQLMDGPSDSASSILSGE